MGGVIPASFRNDFSVFASTTTYPDAMVNYWLAAAGLLMNQRVWGVPALSMPQMIASITGTVLTVTAVSAVPGAALAAGQTLFGAGVSPLTQIASQVLPLLIGEKLGGTGRYNLNQGTPLASQSMQAANSPPTTMLDFCTELFVAHNLVLEQQNALDAISGAAPGEAVGPISSSSVGSVSISYDVSSGILENAAAFNMTVYGTRFFQLARMRGMAPRQIGVGPIPPFSVGAWSGPWMFPEQGDTGF